MNDKLQLLLDQIKIDSAEKNHFEGGKLNKIVCNKAKDKYVFCLSLTNPLPLQTYLDFSQKLKTYVTFFLMSNLLNHKSPQLVLILKH